MKKLVLCSLMLSYASAYTNESPVPGALYAELRSIPGLDSQECVRMYKGPFFSDDNIQKSSFNEYTEPTVCFFDEQGHELIHEPLTDWGNDRHLADKTVKSIQERLTLLPKAHHAKVVFVPIPHSLYEVFGIQLFDEQGNLIAEIEGSGTSFKLGDPLGQSCIEALEDYVANPDILQSLKIVERTQVPNGAEPTIVNQPLVPQALYAEIRSLPGADGYGHACIRIYKGATTPIAPVDHHEYTAPTVCFFDEHGNELTQETYAEWKNKYRGLGHGGRYPIREDITEMVQDIQPRLTVLPVAHHANVLFFKVPYDLEAESDDGEGIEFFSVQLFDEAENKIAQVSGATEVKDESSVIIKVGDPISQACIDALKDYVANPDILGSLTITERIQAQNPDLAD